MIRLGSPRRLFALVSLVLGLVVFVTFLLKTDPPLLLPGQSFADTCAEYEEQEDTTLPDCVYQTSGPGGVCGLIPNSNDCCDTATNTVNTANDTVHCIACYECRDAQGQETDNQADGTCQQIPGCSGGGNSSTSSVQCTTDQDCGDPEILTYNCTAAATANGGTCETIDLVYTPNCQNGRCVRGGYTGEQIQEMCREQAWPPCPPASSAASSTASSVPSSAGVSSSKASSAISSVASSHQSSASTSRSSSRSFSSTSLKLVELPCQPSLQLVGGCSYGLNSGCSDYQGQPTTRVAGGCSKYYVNSNGEAVGPTEYGVCCYVLTAQSSIRSSSSGPFSQSSQASSLSKNSSVTGNNQSSAISLGSIAYCCIASENQNACIQMNNSQECADAQGIAFGNRTTCENACAVGQSSSAFPQSSSRLSTSSTTFSQNSSTNPSFVHCCLDLGDQNLCMPFSTAQECTAVSGQPFSTESACTNACNPTFTASSARSTSNSTPSSLNPLSLCTGLECYLGGSDICASQNQSCIHTVNSPCFRCVAATSTSSQSALPEPPIGSQCDGSECALGGNAFCGSQGQTCVSSPDLPCIKCVASFTVEEPVLVTQEPDPVPTIVLAPDSSSSPSSSPSSSSPSCGNGITEPPEACDLSYLNSNTPNAPCRLDCTAGRCGDFIVDSVREECDDGNTDSNDGCSAFCMKNNDPSLTLPAVVIELPFMSDVQTSSTAPQAGISASNGFSTSVTHAGAPSTPSTGPAALAIMIAGGAAGWMYRRRNGSS
jgi:cysteine-rich repeat protein